LLNKNKVNNYMILTKYKNYSLKNQIKKYKKKKIRNKTNKYFFNLNSLFLMNNCNKFTTIYCLFFKKKKHWWKKIFYKNKFKIKTIKKPSFRYKKYWSWVKKPTLTFENKYLLYIRYFYPYKAYKGILIN
jgi:hypothetical protein